MFNQCTFIGNITKEPEIRTTQNGKNVANFSVAISEGKDKDQITLFMNCTAWEKLSDIVEQYLHKGNRVLVAGKLRQQRWTNKDGTFGEKMVLLVEKLVMLTPKDKNEQQNYTQPQQPESDEPLKEKLPEIDIDDMNVQMPF